MGLILCLKLSKKHSWGDLNCFGATEGRICLRFCLFLEVCSLAIVILINPAKPLSTLQSVKTSLAGLLLGLHATTVLNQI